MTKIALCQMNPTVGDLKNNFMKIKSYFYEAAKNDCDIIIYPECALTGYPLEDLVLKPHFLEMVHSYIEEVKALTQGSPTKILLGTPFANGGDAPFNCAIYIENNQLISIIKKQCLPNYQVFDEKRVFSPGDQSEVIQIAGNNFGVLVCEDMWTPQPAQELAHKGAQCLIVINGSPFDTTKMQKRLDHAQKRCRETGLPLLYINLVGGQDSLVFDGNSFFMDAQGCIKFQAPEFQEGLFLVEINNSNGNEMELKSAHHDENNVSLSAVSLKSIYKALVVGLRDYIEKNKFKGVLIGMSGGIDSALAGTIAVDALGSDRVSCFMMPSKYTSQESIDDAQEVSKLLGISYETLHIEPAVQAFDSILKEQFEGLPIDLTEENIQSRSRGVILMALSNKLGKMVLSTGNKSEMAVGYATLYGDMCGGYNVLKDVYKTEVFKLSRWRNENFDPLFLGPKGCVIPERIIHKPPSAELRPDQKDVDSLPPYDILDEILTGLIEKDLCVDDLVNVGFDRETVLKVQKLFDRAEYKRRQSPPGPKITAKALSFERRYPITNGYITEYFCLDTKNEGALCYRS